MHSLEVINKLNQQAELRQQSAASAASAREVENLRRDVESGLSSLSERLKAVESTSHLMGQNVVEQNEALQSDLHDATIENIDLRNDLDVAIGALKAVAKDLGSRTNFDNRDTYPVYLVVSKALRVMGYRHVGNCVWEKEKS